MLAVVEAIAFYADIGDVESGCVRFDVDTAATHVEECVVGDLQIVPAPATATPCRPFQSKWFPAIATCAHGVYRQRSSISVR